MQGPLSCQATRFKKKKSAYIFVLPFQTAKHTAEQDSRFWHRHTHTHIWNLFKYVDYINKRASSNSAIVVLSIKPCFSDNREKVETEDNIRGHQSDHINQKSHVEQILKIDGGEENWPICFV